MQHMSVVLAHTIAMPIQKLSGYMQISKLSELNVQFPCGKKSP